MKIKLLIFDLDGVLINSKKNMNLSWNFVKKKHDLNQNFNHYFKYIGLPFEKILLKLNIKKNIQNIKCDYNFMSNKKIKYIKGFPKIKETFSYLRKKKIIITILTSKDFLRSKKILDKLKICYDELVCPETKKNLKPKPSGELPKYLIKKFKIKNKNALFIGDTLFDYKSANSAKIPFVFAAYGYGKINGNYFAKINSLVDLKKIIKKNETNNK